MEISRTWLETTDSGDWVLTSENNLSATAVSVLAIAANLLETLCNSGGGDYFQGVAGKEGKDGKSKGRFCRAVRQYGEPGEA